MSRTMGDATAKRRAVIVRVIERSPGITFKDVLKECQAIHAAGKWPQAEWGGARQDPYDVGLRQHVAALVKAGAIEVSKRDGYYDVYAVPLRPHAAEAARLKAEGKNGIEIAELLGLSKSLVYSLLKDPTGHKERERKRNYCPSCGAKKDPLTDCCSKCVLSRAEALMPPKSESAFWQEAMGRASLRGVAFVIGVTPDLKRIIRVDTGRGRLDRVLKSAEDYEDVARELGLL